MLNEKYIERKMHGMSGAPEVKIQTDDGLFYTLTNGAKVKKDVFEKYYEKVPEGIDVDNFFNASAASSKMVQDLFSIDTSRVQDLDSGAQVKVLEQVDHTKTANNIPNLNNLPPDSAIIVDPNTNKPIPNAISNIDTSMYKVVDDDEVDIDAFLQGQQPQVNRQEPAMVQQTDRLLEGVGYTGTPRPQAPVQQVQQPQVNPEEMLFKMFKNNFDIKLTLEFDRKMASPDFIKMMSENFETDIVRYYTRKFLNSIINDPTMLEETIYEQVKNVIFAEEEVKPKKVRTPKKVVIPPAIEESVEVKAPKKPKKQDKK